MRSSFPFKTSAAAGEVDLSTCAREEIHIPGSIQPDGILLVLDPEGRVQQVAIDPELGCTSRELIGQPLAALLDGVSIDFGAVGAEPQYGGTATFRGSRYHLVLHRSGGVIVAELENAAEGEPGSFEDLYPVVRTFLADVDQTADISALEALAAREVRRLTGFDRTMIYRFDEHWNGTVTAEDRNDALPSYLDLRFPASDIPAQARELYRRNKLRLIADADYVPVALEPPLDPATGAPVDLSQAMLRSVSPVHLEYMRNMETWASMSISLIVDGRLWGLISCHNRAPKRVSYHVRTACEFIGQILSLQIGAKAHGAQAQARVERRQIHARLLARVAPEPAFAQALQNNAEELLAITGADGAAILFADQCLRVGTTPPKSAVRAIGDWLAVHPQRDDLFETNRLGEIMPQAAEWSAIASGLLSVSISQIQAGYILWFRPEVVQTVRWGGDPRKPAHVEGERLSPRTSFEAWRETVRDTALPWTSLDREMALELRTSVIDIVLRKAEEMAALNEQLVRSNKELEAFSYSVSHDLRAPFRHIVGYSELLSESAGERLDERERRYVATIVESAKSAGTLVDNLLSFSQMGRSTIHLIGVDMNRLAEEARQQLEMETKGREIEWMIGQLPTVQADPAMLRLVFQNLFSNAIKFTRGKHPATIAVSCERHDGAYHIVVRDNGCGFDMTYAGKLFGVFQRLHHTDEFEGTGIGLANVRRIVERHGGETCAEGAPGEGAAFTFTLPIRGGNRDG
jgi:light-regulated signal transduction histidine kinase (bacteriophytochrome)